MPFKMFDLFLRVGSRNDWQSRLCASCLLDHLSAFKPVRIATIRHRAVGSSAVIDFICMGAIF
jgi:hypothetical protein